MKHSRLKQFKYYEHLCKIDPCFLTWEYLDGELCEADFSRKSHPLACDVIGVDGHDVEAGIDDGVVRLAIFDVTLQVLLHDGFEIWKMLNF